MKDRRESAPPRSNGTGDHKGQYRLNKEKGGSMMERDGRPQGPSNMHQAKNRRALDPPVAGRYWVDGAVGPSSNWSPSRNPSKPARPPRRPGLVAPKPARTPSTGSLVAL